MKIAIVTGASSGMGREMVCQLAERFGGLREIWVIARRTERLDDLKGRIPVRLKCLGLDLLTSEAVAVLKKELSVVHPEVKILVNAAGFGKTGAAGTISEEQSKGMVRLNDEALVAVTGAVLPYMPENSRIIQFASAASFIPQPGFAVYAASKAFVLSYSRALAAELRKKKIFVTAVCPGPVETEFFDIALDGGTLTSYKKWVLEKPETVVSLAIRDSMKGKEISVAGPWMKLFFLLCKCLPHSLIMKWITW